jgi:hypothetical protein
MRPQTVQIQSIHVFGSMLPCHGILEYSCSTPATNTLPVGSVAASANDPVKRPSKSRQYVQNGLVGWMARSVQNDSSMNQLNSASDLGRPISLRARLYRQFPQQSDPPFGIMVIQARRMRHHVEGIDARGNSNFHSAACDNLFLLDSKLHPMHLNSVLSGPPW